MSTLTLLRRSRTNIISRSSTMQAHCFGVEYKDKALSLYGDVSMLSFHATKIFHTIEGGALVCNDRELNEKFDLWKNFGIQDEEVVILPGINGKLNEFQAAMGIINLKYADSEIQKRRKIFFLYKKYLEGIDGIRLLEFKARSKPNYQFVPIQIDENEFKCNRDEVYETLRTFNVFSRKYFHPLGTTYNYFKTEKHPDLKNAEKIAREILCLPSYSELTEDIIAKICEIIKSVQPINGNGEDGATNVD